MTESKSSKKLGQLDLARNAAEPALRLLENRPARLSALKGDIEHLPEGYEKICVQELTDLPPEKSGTSARVPEPVSRLP